MMFEVTEIQAYTQTNLKETLLEFGVSDEYIDNIAHDVEMRVYSLIKIWNDTESKNGILSVGVEEGLYYKPNVSPAIRFFVVVAIRNSMVETRNSIDYRDAGLLTEIRDDQIKQITQDALIYFSKVDFVQLSTKMQSVEQYTFYQDIITQYPTA